MVDTVVEIEPSGRNQRLLNFDLDMERLMHRHGDDWIEMRPVGEPHSPDERDPERELGRGERIYRCVGCDVEMQVVSKRPPG
jgi:hypothetical protein